MNAHDAIDFLRAGSTGASSARVTWNQNIQIDWLADGQARSCYLPTAFQIDSDRDPGRVVFNHGVLVNTERTVTNCTSVPNGFKVEIAYGK